jgi:hypothetical protein
MESSERSDCLKRSLAVSHAYTSNNVTSPDALQKGKLTIAFNRDGGNTDIQIPLELNVKSISNSGERQRSTEAVDSFAACLQALASNEN